MMAPRVFAHARCQVCVPKHGQGQGSRWQVHPNRRMKGSEADSRESGTGEKRQAGMGVARQAAEE